MQTSSEVLTELTEGTLLVCIVQLLYCACQIGRVCAYNYWC
nr:MAG TPA: hypothetical protein [Caudoviricetes sp.]